MEKKACSWRWSGDGSNKGPTTNLNGTFVLGLKKMCLLKCYVMTQKCCLCIKCHLILKLDT
jgi:hypothetical protein